MPGAIRAVTIDEDDGGSEYLTISSAAGLIALVQFGALEIHPWLARNDHLDRPDQMIFDLDPGETVEWGEVLGAAHLLRDLLEELGLRSFPKLTGGKGLHVVVPLTRRASFDLVKRGARAIAARLRDQNPEKFLLTASKSRRKGRIFIDYLRNGRGATAIAPYSVRARPGAPVAVPVRWDELAPAIGSAHYDLHSLPRRLASLPGDPWDGFASTRQSLTLSLLRELGIDPDG
jgi:bifunctional non-homologous end joining protein LigD